MGRPGAALAVLLLGAAVLVTAAPVRAQFDSSVTITAPDTVWVAESSTITFEATIDDPLGCEYGFTAFLMLPLENTATVAPCNSCLFSTSTTITFSWTPTLDDAGYYAVLFRAGFSRFSPCYNRFGALARTIIVVTEAGGEPQFGSVSGHVTADCPTAGTPLYGVPVDVLEAGSGNSLGSAVTDETGAFSISGVPVGFATVNLVTPLGYTAATTSNSIEVLADQDVSSDFALSCQTVVPEARSVGFWKHQFVVATGGHGNAQIDGPTLCSYLDQVEGHFNNNAINPVVIYIPPQSGACDDKLLEGKVLLNLQGSVDMVDRAGQQLLSLLLNVASGRLALFAAASEDGATISQAVTFCDNLIDDPNGDYELAKNIAEMINTGVTVPAGLIPLETANIAYRGRTLLQFAAGPNPASSHRDFRFAMARPGRVALRVFDVHGRLVSRVFEGTLGAGQHVLGWNGRDQHGTLASAGLYFARLSAGSEVVQAKIVQTSR